MDEREFIDTLLRPLGGQGSENFDDDCAWVQVGDRWLVVSTDTSIERVHFPSTVKGAAATERAVRIALSDIYAKAASPIGYLAALSVPRSCPDIMLAAYAAGLQEASDSLGVPLIGGDTTRHDGALTITVTAIGWAGRRLLRNGASVGDGIWITGPVGMSALGLKYLQGDVSLPKPSGEELVSWEDAFLRPDIGLVADLELATASIDVSDGLLADVNQIAKSSGVGCDLRAPDIPFGSAERYVRSVQGLQELVTAGDDYVVAFTAPPDSQPKESKRIGVVTKGTGVRLLDRNGADITPIRLGYSHGG